MSKRPTLPSGGLQSVKRRNLGQPLSQLRRWQVLARDIPAYFTKQPPLNQESFVYVQVEMVWLDQGRVSLVDVHMSHAKHHPARFSAVFTGDCSDFTENLKPPDQLCLYLSDATVRSTGERRKQDTLNLSFTLTWDKTCRLKRVEGGVVGGLITFPTCT
jgi:hypothetical protein